MNVRSWWTGNTESTAWLSLQGDPNYCDGSCKPAIQTGVTFASISSDGVTYTALTGDVICKSWLDSVQNFGAAGTWNWLAYSSPFDPTLTMGLYVKSKVFGVMDAPTGFEYLNNATVEVFEITERNNRAVPNWRFGAVVDYDVVGATDTCVLDQSISAAWDCGKSGATDQAGMIKLPYGGCGLAPMVNAVTLNGDQALYKLSSAPGPYFWDSCYSYLNLPAGTTKAQSYSSTDREWFCTLAAHDFAPLETVKFASVNFDFAAVATPKVASAELISLSRTLNKMLGFGRGDVNNDGVINLLDIVYLNETVNAAGPGAIPFAHLGDVNGDGLINGADVTYLVAYYFGYGACPVGVWTM
jgi:hypothetical protein